MSWVAIGAAAVSAGVGIYQTVSANKKAKRAGKQIPFSTSKEAYDVNEFAQSLSQSGFDAGTMSYFNNAIGRNTADSVFNTMRTGGNPNQVAASYDQGLEAMFRLGADNSKLQYENFNRYITSMLNLDQNAGAEWASQENIRKDQLQAADAQKKAGMQTIVGAVSNAASGYANYKIGQSYDEALRSLGERLQGSDFPSLKYGKVDSYNWNGNQFNPAAGTLPRNPNYIKPVDINEITVR